MVEVGHDDLEALVLLADQVLNGDLDVLEGDVGSSRGPDTLAVHAASGDATGLAFNEQNTESIHAGLAGADGHGEVVGPDTVGDPLLLTVDDVVLTILGELGLTAQAGDVGSCVRLSDGKADALVTVEDAGQNAVLQGLATKVHDWRATNTETSNDVPDETSRGGAGKLISDNQLVEEIPLLWCDGSDTVWGVLGREVVRSHQTGKVSAGTHFLVDALGDLLGLVPLSHEWLNLLLNPGADLGAQGDVALVVVWGVVLRIVSNLIDAHVWYSVARTVWYHDGSAYGIKSPNSSNGSKSALSTLVTVVVAAGLATAAGAGGGGGGAAAFLVSKDPTWSLALYFLRIPAMMNQNLRGKGRGGSGYRTIVVFPELLRGVLSGDLGEDLLSTWNQSVSVNSVVDNQGWNKPGWSFWNWVRS